MRRIFQVTFAALALMSLATAILRVRSYRRPVTYRYHDKDGTKWEIAARNGEFVWENEAASQVRELHALDEKIAPDQRRIQQLHSEWSRTPDHSEKNRLRILEPILASNRRLEDLVHRRNELAVQLTNIYFNLERRGIRPAPPVSRAMRCSVVAGTMAAASALAWIGWPAGMALRQRRRRRSGRCICCGYDLRGSRDRCPECGSLIANVQTEAAAHDR